MSVTESRRLTLFDHARSSLGEEAATTLMDLLPPDVDQLATKADLHVLGSDLGALGSELRSEMSALGSELRSEMSALGSELRSEMSALGAEHRVHTSELRAEMYEGFARFSAAMAEQTRTLILSMMGIMLTGIALAFAAARLG